MKKYIFAIVFISNLFAQVDYNTHIQPIFDNNCTSCHMYGNASGGLTLTSYSGVMTNSNSGASVVPEDHANSYLWQRVNNGSMPPQNNPDLNADQINLIAQWIDEGALETPAVDYAGPVWNVATTGSDDIAEVKLSLRIKPHIRGVIYWWDDGYSLIIVKKFKLD